MTGTSGALGFLVRRTLYNRLARQGARLRNPRYALAAILGIAYVFFVFLRPGTGQTPPGLQGTSPVLGTVGGLGLALTVLVWWLGRGATSALAFQPAEVQLLFPAPITRRQLIGYKVVRSQILVLVNCLLWMLLVRRWGITLPAPLRFATIWGFFSVLSLHRLGVALVMTPPIAGGRRVVLLAARALAAAAVVLLVAGTGPVLRQFGSLGMPAGLRALGTALASPPASYALAPFRLVLAPLAATTTTAWLAAFAVVAGIVALHLVWVLSMNVSFEEMAATASAEVAQRVAAFKARRAGGAAVMRPGKPVRDWIPLGPGGPPAVAIVWKNTVALIRTGMIRTAIILLVLILVTSQVMASAEGGRRGPGLAIPFLVVAAMTLVMGPRAVRNDLRQDLLHLASIKSYPLAGATVVAAEMASPTLLLTVFELALILVGWFMLPAGARPAAPASVVVAAAVVIPFALLAINAISVGIQNAAALLFPGWVRLGPDSGGVEAIGQTMMVTIGSFLVLILSLIVPATVGIGVGVAAARGLDAGAFVAGGVAGVLLLGLEVVLLVRVLGRVFERTDPTALG